MMKPRRLLIPLSVFLLAALGCGKKQMDTTVDHLVQAALRNDYGTFRTLAHPDLTQAFPERKLQLLSRALGKLGSYGGRTLTGINISTGDVRSGSYSLSFQRGKVDLELTLTKGQLTALNFSGEAMKGAMKQISQEEFATFKVSSFEFLDAAKSAKSNIYKMGDLINFRLVVQGLTRSPEGLKLRVHLRVFNASGAQVYFKEDFLNTTLPLKEEATPVATVTGELKLPVRGMYKLTLQIIDVTGRRHLEHSQAFSVES